MSYEALDWLVRQWTPTWLEQAGHWDEAAELRELGPLSNRRAAQAAERAIQRATTVADDSRQRTGTAFGAVPGRQIHFNTMDPAWQTSAKILDPVCAIASRRVDENTVAAAKKAAWAARAAALAAATYEAAFYGDTPATDLPRLKITPPEGPAEIINWTAAWAEAGAIAAERLQPTMAQMRAAARAQFGIDAPPAAPTQPPIAEQNES